MGEKEPFGGIPGATTECPLCHHIIRIGDYPFCPHGRSETAIARDEIPGGVLLENYGPQPIRFYSHSERRAYMKANGLEEREKFTPMPGTDRDPAGIPNPKGYVDEKTLENGRVLLMRQQNTPTEKDISEREETQIKEGEVRPFVTTGSLPKSAKKRWRKYGI